MDRLKQMKEQLMTAAQSQMSHLDCVDAKELGEVMDMIKDLSEAVYYCSITEAMEESKDQPKMNNNYYYTQPSMNDQDYNMGRMYYSGGNGGSMGGNSGSSGNSYYTPREPYYREQPYMMNDRMFHDSREGRSYASRKMYMESKEMHKDGGTQMRELENYIQDLTQDVTEMIEKASPEEKQVLQQKIATLASKIK